MGIFGKCKKIHFSPKCVWAYVLPGPEGTVSSKTLRNAKVAPWEHFFDQNDPSAFETVIYLVRWMTFRSQNAFGSPKRVLELLFHFWTQMSCAWQGLHKGKSGAGKIGELLAPRALLGTTWATWGPPGAEGLSCLWPRLPMA